MSKITKEFEKTILEIINRKNIEDYRQLMIDNKEEFANDIDSTLKNLMKKSQRLKIKGI